MNKRGRPAYKPTTGERRLLTRLENTVEDIEDIIALRDELLKALSESPVPTAMIAKAARMAPTTIAKLRQLQEVRG